MFNFLKPPKFPAVLLIIASFATLILLPLFFFMFKMTLSTYATGSGNDKYFFKRYDSDPLITNVPDLKDMLSGPVISNSDPSFGDVNAPVTLVEYSDFQCGFCQNQENVLKQILKEYGNKIRLVWKDYPEGKINSPSWEKSIAARCAGEQNQFWPYHDLLFKDTNGGFSTSQAIALAKELKLDDKKFSACLADPGIRSGIRDDITEANALQITGVPFIYVNNQELMGATSLDDLKNVIDKQLNK